MLSRFWEKDFQKNLLQEKKKIIKKHKAEFVAFLEKKYGKEYYNKAVSERELIRDINEFEAYREEKNSTNVDKKIKKTPAKKIETANHQKPKLKPKRAPKIIWLLNNGKVKDISISEKDDEEENENDDNNEHIPNKRPFFKLGLDDIEFEVDNDNIEIVFPLNGSKRWLRDKNGLVLLKKEVVKELEKMKKFWQQRKAKNKQKEYDIDIFLKEKYGKSNNKTIRKIKKIRCLSAEDVEELDTFLEGKYGFNPFYNNEFCTFLKEKYGKASEIVISEAEHNGGFYDEDIEDFEKHREAKTLKANFLNHSKENIKQETSKKEKPTQKTKNKNLQKYKLKPKRAPKRIWIH